MGNLWLHLLILSACCIRCWGSNPGSCWDVEVFGMPPVDLPVGLCRRSRINIGDTTRLHAVLTKIVNGQCISVVTLGGSIACGVSLTRKGRRDSTCSASTESIDCIQDAFPAQFVQWLNKRYPCKGGKHVSHNLCKRARSSDYFVEQVSGWQKTPKHPIWTSDLILVDSAMNDMQTVNFKSLQKADKQSGTQVAVELLYRLLANSPAAPAVVWIATSFRENPQKPPYRTDAVSAHMDVMRYYHIPYVSMPDAVPLEHHQIRNWTQQMFVSDVVHPTLYGHRVLASLLAYTLVTEELRYLGHDFQWKICSSAPDAQTSCGVVYNQGMRLIPTESFVIPREQLQEMPPLLFTDPAVLARYSRGAQFAQDLTKPVRPNVIDTRGTHGFVYQEEYPKSTKFGYIGAEIGSLLRIPIPRGITTFASVHIGLLRSYHDVGVVSVGVFNYTSQSYDNRAVKQFDCFDNSAQVSIRFRAELSFLAPIRVNGAPLAIDLKVVAAPKTRSVNRVMVLDVAVY